MLKVAVVTVSDRAAGDTLAAGQNKDMSHRKIITSPACRAPACCTLDIAGPEQERFIRMLKAAGNPTRFEILKYLVTHPGCITGDIVKFLPIAQATVSQHLKVLREAGWISGEVEGPAVNYHLNETNIKWFRSKVDKIF